MHKNILAFLFFAFTASHLFSAPGVIYENRLIEKIDIYVNVPENQAADEAQVRSKMKTRENNFFSQTDFDEDLKNLAQEFDKVDPSISVIDGKLFITIKIWPKPTIRSITYEGNASLATRKLQKELGISICTVFDRCAFNEAFHKLKAYYVKKGFFEAELDYAVKYDACTNEVDIVIKICEGRSGRIKKIRFAGFLRCEQDEILDFMVTKEYNAFLSWLTEEGTFREDAMQHDKFQILNYMQNRGYADAQVDIIVEEAGCNRLIVTISVIRGELYKISCLTFKGNTIISDEQINNVISICPGYPYSPEKIRDITSAIQDLYGKRGYIEAFADFTPKLEDDCTYSIEIDIEEGDPYRVGLIKVFGNCVTETRVILHETLLIPGEVFNSTKLKLSQERLENIGYFKKVNVYWVKSDTCQTLPGNYRDVHIEVEETNTGKLGIFAGYSTNDSLFCGLNITENNFNHKGLFTFWSQGFRTLRGAGEYLAISAQFGMKSRNYVISWTRPYFMDTNWSIGFDADYSNNRNISDAYEITAVGLAVRAGYQINPFLRFQWHQRVRDSHVTVIEKEKMPKDVDEKDGTVSAQGISLTYDSTDSIKKPTKGFRSQFEAELAGIWGDYTFFSTAYLNSYYIKISSKSVLKLRCDLRFICPFGKTDYNTLPLDERIFMGGANFVRGYKPYSLGPVFMGKDKEGNEVRTNIPSGGISEQLYSIEYNYFLSKKVDAFVFVDAGHLTKKYWDFSSERVRTSCGFGFRLELLPSLPPISFGLGFPINPRQGERKNFFLQFGVKF